MALVSPEVLSGLARLVRGFAGLELPAWVVESKAGARMTALSLDGPGYLSLVESGRGASELGRLVEALRVGETRFFRHKGQLDAVLEVVAPRWREAGTQRPKVWSAGCATGEEPYTLAMVLARALPAPAYRASILATDVSEEALATASRRRYPAEALAHVPPPFLDSFVVSEGEAEVRREIAGAVRFERHNLASAPPGRGFHLVFCRNVLIYFEPEERRRALERIVDALAPGGALFLGYSETLRDVAGLAPVQVGAHTLWLRSGGEPPSSRDVPRDAPASVPRSLARPSAPVAAPRTSRTVRASAASALSRELSEALKSEGLEVLTVELDAAELLDDDAAVVLRRAGAAARASGVDLRLVAGREVTLRWLRRHGLGGGAA